MGLKREGLLYLALLTVTVIWGGASIATKHALNYLQPLELVLLRAPFTALIFILILWLAARDVAWAILRKEWRSLSAMGLFGALFYQVASATGQQHISAGMASLITCLSPAFIYALCWQWPFCAL